jgi:hypothetical protein
MPQKSAPVEREIKEMLRDAKKPAWCLTRRRRVRSGCTHAEIGELDILADLSRWWIDWSCNVADNMWVAVECEWR